MNFQRNYDIAAINNALGVVIPVVAEINSKAFESGSQ